MTVAGFTSTGSKRPDALFGDHPGPAPRRMHRSSGCRVRDTADVEYLDFIMGLGAVALGYGHPEVNAAATEAIARGVIGPLPPEEEEQLARELRQLLPGMEAVRFLKSGAEAVAAAVRLARVHSGREKVLGCGYHGWLDWCNDSRGIPEGTRAAYDTIPFNDSQQAVERIRALDRRLACVVIEPVVERAPDTEWLELLRRETRRVGALLIYDEIKTAFRVSLGGAAARFGGEPDLQVLGKALANGFPLAAVGGRREVMEGVSQTWISSTMATEFVSLAAARATIAVARRVHLPEHLSAIGSRLKAGLEQLAERFPALIHGVGGIAEMCYLRYSSEETSAHAARECAARGLLFKRNAYNFVSLAHQAAEVERALEILDEVLSETAART